MVVHAYRPSYSGGGSRRITSENRLGKRERPYLKNKLKTKGLGHWLMWQRACLVGTKPWVQSSELEKTKTNKQTKKRSCQTWLGNKTGVERRI
jgi:hypothetical protein